MVIYKDFKVNGVLYTDGYGLTITKTTGENYASSTCEVMFPNENGQHNSDFNIGDEVIVYSDKNILSPTTKIFTGIIRNIEKTNEESVKQDIRITSRDYSSVLQDSIVEPEIYNNYEVSTIINDLMTKYDTSGISTSGVQVTTTTLKRIVFKGDNVFDCIKQLTEIVDYLFYVDENKILHVEVKGTVSSGITLDEQNVLQSTFKETADQEFYNKVWVYGDLTFTGVKEIIAANGGSIYPLQYSPSNTRIEYLGSTMIGGVDTFIGDIPSGTQYVVNYYDKTIEFLSGTDFGNSIIPNGGSFIADYQRQKQIIKYSENPDSISQYWSVGKIVVDRGIKDPDHASVIAKNLISKYSLPRRNFTINLYTIANLVAGQTVNVNIPNKGIYNSTYNIIEVTYDFTPENMLQETVLSVSLNQHIATLTDTIKDIKLQLKKLQAQNIETDIISRLSVDYGKFYFNEKKHTVYNAQTGQSFVIGHPTNGVIGNLGVPSGLLMSGAQFISGPGKKWGASALWNPGSPGNGVTFSNGSKVSASVYSGITIMLWCNPDINQPGGGAGSIPTLIAKTTDTTYPLFRVDINSFSDVGKIRFTTADNGSTSRVNVVTSGSYVFSGLWSHIACSFSYGSCGKIYHNGSLVASGIDVNHYIGSASNVPINIGWYRPTLRREFIGKIDDVSIYNRELSPMEIGSSYRGFINYSGLVFWADFEECSGLTTYNNFPGSIQPLIGDHRHMVLEYNIRSSDSGGGIGDFTDYTFPLAFPITF